MFRSGKAETIEKKPIGGAGEDDRGAREQRDHHSSPEEAGRIFNLAKPKLAVYSHIVFATQKPVPDVPEEALIARTRTTYRGPLVVGRDLMSFAIGDAVQAFDAKGEPMQPLLADQYLGARRLSQICHQW